MQQPTLLTRDLDPAPIPTRASRRSLRKTIITITLAGLALPVAAGLYWQRWQIIAHAEPPTAPVLHGERAYLSAVGQNNNKPAHPTQEFSRQPPVATTWRLIIFRLLYGDNDEA